MVNLFERWRAHWPGTDTVSLGVSFCYSLVTFHWFRSMVFDYHTKVSHGRRSLVERAERYHKLGWPSELGYRSARITRGAFYLHATCNSSVRLSPPLWIADLCIIEYAVSITKHLNPALILLLSRSHLSIDCNIKSLPKKWVLKLSRLFITGNAYAILRSVLAQVNWRL